MILMVMSKMIMMVFNIITMMMMQFNIITMMMMIMMMILNNDYENGLPIIFIESLITVPSLELDILTKTSRSAKRYLIVMMVS